MRKRKQQRQNLGALRLMRSRIDIETRSIIIECTAENLMLQRVGLQTSEESARMHVLLEIIHQMIHWECGPPSYGSTEPGYGTDGLFCSEEITWFPQEGSPISSVFDKFHSLRGLQALHVSAAFKEFIPMISRKCQDWDLKIKLDAKITAAHPTIRV